MLASHYLRAVEYAGAGGVVREELVERTVRALRDAGDRALSLHAYPLAAGFYERAMALQPDGASGPRRELLLSLGDALARAGDQERARETFMTAAELARRSGAAEHLARAALGYGGRFIWSRAWGDPHSSPSSRRPWRSWAMRTATCASVCWRGWPRVRCVTRFRLSRARR
jgi:tetratricopeptide (TPR) repeat protein